MKDIKVIAIDADDTLWDNQSYYDKAGEVFADTLKEYGEHDWLLDRLFDKTVIVCDKNREEYLGLCDSESILPEQLLMIGNSFKSDIQPVVELGGSGIYIPFHTVWKHEEAEEFDSPDIIRLGKFSEISGVLLHS